MFVVTEIQTPAAGSSYSFTIVRTFGLERRDIDARRHMVKRVKELGDRDARSQFSPDRAVLEVNGETVGMSDDCPVKIVLTVTEIH